jgi:hypothetical protein
VPRETAGSQHAKARVLQSFGGRVPDAGGCPCHQGNAERLKQTIRESNERYRKIFALSGAKPD